ncbi:MAG: hypothetical protein ACRDSP_00050 [Pseudonocardiaceae bacterium]
MSDPVSTLPMWQLHRLVLLVDALGDVPMTSQEQASLAIVAGQDRQTVESLATVIRRARGVEL